MFVFGKDRKLVPSSSADALRDSVFVFEGEFTANADKAKIVDTVLGLWALCLSNKGDLLVRVTDEYARTFPRHYFGEMPALLEQEIGIVATAAPSKHSHRSITKASTSLTTMRRPPSNWAT